MLKLENGGEMASHIKRDGGWLCGKDQIKPKLKRYSYRHSTINFSTAHRIDFGNTRVCLTFCKQCVEKYYEILNNLEDPIVIEDPLFKTT